MARDVGLPVATLEDFSAGKISLPPEAIQKIVDYGTVTPSLMPLWIW
jgi:hypothetical protein